MVRNVIFDTVKKQKWLSLGIVVAVVGAVVATLIPPLILAKIVDTITAGTGVSVPFIVLYFLMLALTGFLESAREGLLTVFGQKITHALRSRLMEKFVNLTADSINQQEPGTLVSRFVGDVDTVENLFTSGIISMFADACQDRQHSGRNLVSEPRSDLRSARDPSVTLRVYETCAEKYAGSPDREPESRWPGFRSCAGDPAQHPDDPLPRQRELYGRALRPVHRRELSG